jgi:hypothetical protein
MFFSSTTLEKMRTEQVLSGSEEGRVGVGGTWGSNGPNNVYTYE